MEEYIVLDESKQSGAMVLKSRQQPGSKGVIDKGSGRAKRVTLAQRMRHPICLSSTRNIHHQNSPRDSPTHHTSSGLLRPLSPDTMEDQAATLLATLKKSSTPVDTKLTLFNNLKSNIKHLRVPDAAQAPIFDCVRLAIASQNSTALVLTGFSSLGHLIKRLNLQNQGNVVVAQAGRLFPILLDRLGDPRENNRNAASQILADLWPFCDKDVERVIRDQAMTGTNARAKEVAMVWVVKVRGR